MARKNDLLLRAFLFAIALILALFCFILIKGKLAFGTDFPAMVNVSSTFANPANVKALYLTSDTVRNPKKMFLINKLLDETELNGVIIDVKVGKPAIDKELEKIVADFNRRGVWTIARIVVMQDSRLATRRPELAIKNSKGELWRSGKREWQRYWVDPASKEVVDYNIQIAKQAIDAGFKEIQFDYIRFPSDGNMRDIVYPHYKGGSKYEVMDKFFARLTSELKAYRPEIVLSVDIFGEAYVNGRGSGIGQDLKDIEKYFDVISPMNYPSHFNCGEFGFHDPNQHPYEIMSKSLSAGKKHLTKPSVIIRPWLQAFSIANIYKCGGKIVYGKDELAAQIKAVYDNKHYGWMLWNASNRYSEEDLKAILAQKN